MESAFQQTKPLLPSWTSTPVPSLTLSAAGLLALADLNTIAHRTVITGGSSWLDALVLAPGLHYQQAVDALDKEFEPGLFAVLQDASGIGSPETTLRYSIANAAMAQYIRRLWQEAGANGVLTLNVGVTRNPSQIAHLMRVFGELAMRKSRSAPTQIEIDWLSHVFYIASPILTVAAGTFVILLADWWSLAFIAALMISRILNIWSIKQRAGPPLANTRKALPSAVQDREGEYAINLGNGSRIVLRGFRSDIRAITTQVWLRRQTVAESYLEAVAKLIVYLVAAFSGNQTQAGAMVLMALLLTSAGLLALSNAHSRGLQMNGRMARLQNAPEAEAVAAVAKAEAEAQRDWAGERENGRMGGELFEDLHMKKSVAAESASE